MVASNHIINEVAVDNKTPRRFFFPPEILGNVSICYLCYPVKIVLVYSVMLEMTLLRQILQTELIRIMFVYLDLSLTFTV